MAVCCSVLAVFQTAPLEEQQRLKGPLMHPVLLSRLQTAWHSNTKTLKTGFLSFSISSLSPDTVISSSGAACSGPAERSGSSPPALPELG